MTGKKEYYQKLLNELKHTNTLFQSDKMKRELQYLSNILSGKQLKIKWDGNE